MSFVAGVGITNIDLIYSGLEHLPDKGKELYATGFQMQLGGGVVATTASLAHLGVPTKTGTYLGTDLFSGYAREQMALHGMNIVNLLRASTGSPVCVTSVAITPGDRTFLSYCDSPPTDDAALEQIYAMCRGARIVEMQPGYLEVYRKLKQDGCILVLDMGWDEEMDLAKYEEYLLLADYFTPNRDEAMKITGANSPQQAADRLQRYFDKVLVKMDSQGCLVLEDGNSYMVRSIDSYPHVDATGAGDAFLAGLLYGLYHGKSLAQSVLYGNITGGNCVSQIGCLANPLDEASLLRLAEAYGDYLP